MRLSWTSRLRGSDDDTVSERGSMPLHPFVEKMLEVMRASDWKGVAAATPAEARQYLAARAAQAGNAARDRHIDRCRNPDARRRDQGPRADAEGRQADEPCRLLSRRRLGHRQHRRVRLHRALYDREDQLRGGAGRLSPRAGASLPHAARRLLGRAGLVGERGRAAQSPAGRRRATAPAAISRRSAPCWRATAAGRRSRCKS